MASRSEHRAAAERLGVHAEAGEWCTIDKIPQPPADVLQSAGRPLLRPGRLRPLGLVGAGFAALFTPLVIVLSLLSDAGEALMRALSPKSERERLRAKDADDRRRDALIAERGLDGVFDGNWDGDAGRYLLGWYGQSTHPERLVLAVDDGIVLAAPPRRVSVGKEKHMRVVARLSASEAVLVDPFNGEFDTRIVLIRFRDRSWLRLGTVEPRSALHRHLLRRPLPDS
ncbi:hypothetical protein ACIBSR_30610 [Streptomyces sp. NPDC049936]|uniref:hypothetical protein n=1 Tax=Streptomyces sp. NPDC049936 TaxID=3365599 RepID=UPI0037B28601